LSRNACAGSSCRRISEYRASLGCREESFYKLVALSRRLAEQAEAVRDQPANNSSSGNLNIR
jgi:hypothetical protein